MVKRFFADFGTILLKIIKALIWVLLHLLQMVLEAAKLILLLFGLVARLFLAFVRAGTP